MTIHQIEDAIDALRGKSYADVGGCWGLVRSVLACTGITLPADPAGMLLGGQIGEAVNGLPAAGDLVSMVGNPGHVGVMLDAWRVAHTTSLYGFRIDRLDALKRMGKVLGLVRLDPAWKPVPEVAPGQGVRLTAYDDIVTRSNRRTVHLAAGPRDVLSLARATLGRMDVLVVVNGRMIAREAGTLALRDGDDVVCSPNLRDPYSIAAIAIAVISTALSYFLAPRGKFNTADSGKDPEERRYGWNRFSRDAFLGDIAPVVLGRRVRYGGKVMSAIPEESTDGSGGQRLRILICMSVGEMAEMCGRTSDFDDVPLNQLTGVYIQDQGPGDDSASRVWGRFGAVDQPVIPGFDDTETPREVGIGGAVLRNTDGAERTGSTPSGETISYTTLTEVNAVRIRVRFARGLFNTSATGQVEPRQAKYRYAYRTVGGTWSAWKLIKLTQASQSEFASTPRQNLSTTAAIYEIRVERVSAEPADVTAVDEMTLDTIVEVQDTTNNYGGFSVLAIELVAGEKYSGGLPKLGFDVKGVKVRVWDGVSDPTSPVFTREWSANPMYLSLEVATNTQWGYARGDTAVDIPKLLQIASECDSVVALPGGGTRPKFACNLVMDDAKDSLDWLRTIAKTCRAVPIPLGKRLTWVYDGIQTIAADRFGDGDIAVDQDGKPEFHYLRELGTGGIVRPNHFVAQFENELQNGGSDADEFPLDGEEWLATEQSRTESSRLDGVTHPHQVACELVFRAKGTRFVTRGVKFATSKQVVTVQPGDRMDVACSVAGWGLASGRLLEGCTTTTVRIDRAVTVAAVMGIGVMHLDGTYQLAMVTADAGDYAVGEDIQVSELTQAPDKGASYSVGVSGIEFKPFICTRVSYDSGRKVWSLEGREYIEDVYNDTVIEVTEPRYGNFPDIGNAPGPVLDLRARERRVGTSTVVDLSWRQTPADAAITSSFRIGRRVVGTQAWVVVPNPAVGTRGSVVELTDSDKAYELAVTAVSWGGLFIPFDDPRTAKVALVLGLSSPPPPPPTGLTLMNSGNVYTLSWDAVDGADGYQVLYGGDVTTRPNTGAENCLVLARTTETQLTGLVLTTGKSATFWVRSVGPSGRLSFSAASVTAASPPSPMGKTVKLATTLDLESTGTAENTVWNVDRLELDNAAVPGTWVSGVIDTGSATMTELALRPHTFNAADDPTIGAVQFTVPGIEADQWGIVTSGPKVVGMLFPPWPDDRQAWKLECKTDDGTNWTAWGEVPPCGKVSRVIRRYQIRVTMQRNKSPYRPALAGLDVVATH